MDGVLEKGLPRESSLRPQLGSQGSAVISPAVYVCAFSNI